MLKLPDDVAHAPLDAPAVGLGNCCMFRCTCRFAAMALVPAYLCASSINLPWMTEKSKSWLSGDAVVCLVDVMFRAGAFG